VGEVECIGMKRYLSPWRYRPYSNGNPAYRRFVLGAEPPAFLLVSKGIRYWLDTKSEGWDTMEDAINASDRHAIEEGYEFLTEEQWEKLSVLV